MDEFKYQSHEFPYEYRIPEDKIESKLTECEKKEMTKEEVEEC